MIGDLNRELKGAVNFRFLAGAERKAIVDVCGAYARKVKEVLRIDNPTLEAELK